MEKAHKNTDRPVVFDVSRLPEGVSPMEFLERIKKHLLDAEGYDLYINEEVVAEVLNELKNKKS